MPTSKAKTAATWTTKAANEVGHAAYEALQDSLDAAATAAKLLRGDLRGHGHDTLREVERLVRDAQRDLRRGGKQLLSELQALADQASAPAPTRRRAGASKAQASTRRPAAGRAAATKPKPSSARAATAKKAAAKTTAAKKAATSRAGAAKPSTTKRTKPAAAKAPAAAKRTTATAKVSRAKRT